MQLSWENHWYFPSLPPHLVGMFPCLLVLLAALQSRAAAPHGTVLRLGDDKPLAGAQLQIRSGGTTLSSTDGSFRFGQSLGTGSSPARSPSLRLHKDRLTVSLPEPTILSLELRRPDGRLSWRLPTTQKAGTRSFLLPRLTGTQVLHWKTSSGQGSRLLPPGILHLELASAHGAASRSAGPADTLIATLAGFDTLRLPLPSDTSTPLTLRLSPLPANRAWRFLKTSGKEIRNADGRRLLLRGVNLGGWLVTETWMCGIKDTLDTTKRATRLTLERRFGVPQTDSLMGIWEDRWITARDLDRIAAAGLNHVRVPFGWRNFQRADGSWIRKQDGNLDFSRLDWIVREAGNRGLYSLLDFHVWPQQVEVTYGLISDQDSVRGHTAAIWEEVARHFKGNPDVAGYNLMNEPTGSWKYTLPDSLYRAVRRIDPDHMISMEWVEPDPVRWQNVLYQNHHYIYGGTLADNQAAFDKIRPEIRKHDSLGVPFYVGETHMDGDSSWAWVLGEYSRLGVSWSPWTWKTVNGWGWCVASLYPEKVSVNVQTDSYDTLRARWSHLDDPSLENTRTGTLDAWGQAARVPW